MKIRSHALLIILICLILFIQPSSILGQMEDTSTTRADGNQPPQVIDVSPAKGSSSRVSIDEDIIVSFNEFMDKGQTEDAFTLSSNKDGDITGKFNWVGYTLIFDPNNELDHGTTFTVTISTNARNLTGVNFTQEFKWNFTTVEGESGSGKSDDKSL